ncbi:hypothetical protein KYK30_23545 [Shinella yambaruensis]|uniref:Uncharacterized protein n=1 Tax=Shinella yambaruensis TaxID=415996 RepID=A0ABQ5ZBM7_9HYPH|nr:MULTISPECIES: hypothetical protein [Shinella]MCJ8028589.1 hypothetical protein [Shinella yambaruensis]MCU7982678.1 hypothetical protein [Shinella yambaruensis]MCW5712607.1 hypothetical protein [Shinella sp.]GLR49025.1 hypothetical protein GCM10007923_02300 [Shinella yambaruensis]
MKIDGSMLSAYTYGRPRATSGESLNDGTGGGTAGRNIPTVSPTAPIPSGLANALWLTQAKLDKAETESASLTSEFLELSRMTPAERLRKEMLEALGLTEESLAQLPEEERSAIEEDIRRAIKEQLGIDDTRQAGTAEGQSAAGTEEAGA